MIEVGLAFAGDRVSASAIECRRVSVCFGESLPVVDQVDLNIPSGQIMALIGPSGCGKTTLLRTIAGLQAPSDGTVRLDPPAIARHGEIGFVFQQPALLPWASSLQNVLIPLDLIGRGTRSDRRSAALASLRSVKLDDAAHKLPAQLSGGMQMRVSIARALVTQPSILLLDEPFAALDEMLRNDLGRLILDLWSERRFTAVMVTHNIAESILLSHRVAVMRDGALKAVVENPLSWPRDPMMMRTAEFGSFFGVVSDLMRGPGDAVSIQSAGSSAETSAGSSAETLT